MYSTEFILFGIATLLILSVFASKISDKFGIPALFIFLGLGMLAGSDGIAGIYFDDNNLARNVGSIALIFILFAGGLDTVWKDIKPVFRKGLALATFGVLFTATLIAWFVHFFFNIPLLESFLLGAIISSTDAAAVFAILRAKGVSLKPQMRSLLEFESGSNDPMAIFLTLTIIQMITMPETASFNSLVIQFFLQFLVGGILGYIFGVSLPYILNKVHLSFYGLYPALTIAWVLLLFSVSSFAHGNGFLSVYVAGICINARDFVHKKSLVGFHDGVAWIMQIIVFLTLGLLVFPSQLLPVASTAIIIALWIIFFARPIGVFLTLLPSSLLLKEKAFISWVGLRGAVPIILATYPFLSQLKDAQLLFNTVFFVVLFSILLQGTTLSYVAKLLKVEQEHPKDEIIESKSYPLIQYTLQQICIPPDSKAIGLSIAELNIPQEMLILLINRDDRHILPEGDTIIKENDLMLVQSDNLELVKIVAKEINKKGVFHQEE